MKDEYEVGYGKPPKATRFGARPQPNRSSRPRLAKEAAVDVAAAINRPITITRNGTSVRMHPHEAMMLGLAKNALRGKLRAMKEFFSECKKAGLLDSPPVTEGNYSVLYSGRRPLSILAELDVSHFPWFERLGSFTAAGYRIQTGICGGSA